MIDFPSFPPPNILYKYLGAHGAKDFLAKPQLRFTRLTDLDDILDTIPGFTPQTDSEADRNALERVLRTPLIESISIEKQIAYYKGLGKLPPDYLERLMRETREKQNKLIPYVCSMSAEPGSLAMWSLYAQRHAGIVFGITSKLNRVILDKGRIAYGMTYSPDRPHTAFNNPKGEDVAPTLWTKGMDWAHQEEWRIISETPDVEYLELGEVKEVIFGYRYDSSVTGEKSERIKQDIFQQTRFFEAIPSPTKYKMALNAIA